MSATPANYYNADDVMRLTGYAINKCRKIIKGLNDELVEKGYITVPGKIPKKYYHERFYIDAEVQPNEKDTGKSKGNKEPDGRRSE